MLPENRKFSTKVDNKRTRKSKASAVTRGVCNSIADNVIIRGILSIRQLFCVTTDSHGHQLTKKS